MACGHVKCWVDEQPAYMRKFDSNGPRDHIAKEMLGPIPGYCTACESIRLERAAALREIAETLHKRGHDRAMLIVEEVISDSDRSALDAHDAEVRDRAVLAESEWWYNAAADSDIGHYAEEQRLTANRAKASKP